MVPPAPVLAAPLFCSPQPRSWAPQASPLLPDNPALDRVSIWLGGYHSHDDTRLSAEGTGPYTGMSADAQHSRDAAGGSEGLTWSPRCFASS